VERRWRAPAGDARLTFAAIGREQSADLAPAEAIALGAFAINRPVAIADPGRVAGPRTRDEIEEARLGASAAFPLTTRLLLSGSFQSVRYEKRYAPVAAPPTAQIDDEWSGHAAATFSLAPWAAAYAAYVTGLEESGTAPAIAVNANETLPALRATQREAGVKLSLGEGARLLLSAFEIDKPAPGFDPTGVWRLSGARRHRGIEASLVGNLAGVRIVAGGLWLDAAIREADGTAAEVVGEPPRRVSLNAQWRVPGVPPLALDAGVYAQNSSPARRDGSADLPARTDVSVGGNWRVGARDGATVLRVAIDNVLGERGWSVSGDEGLYPRGPRTVRVTVTTSL
jgi:iron complex outermembrane receptor protein